ncbi:MAG: hypothetical protein GY774_07375 [Planctomycetes bacterium]|nr:hypothetical protein [Planctomycetota bacterium]
MKKAFSTIWFSLERRRDKYKLLLTDKNFRRSLRKREFLPATLILAFMAAGILLYAVLYLGYQIDFLDASQRIMVFFAFAMMAIGDISARIDIAAQRYRDIQFNRSTNYRYSVY